MKLLNYSPPFPDEMLLSSFLRNLRENAIDLQLFEQLVLGLSQFQHSSMQLGLNREFEIYLRALNMDTDAGQYLLSTSILLFCAIFMSHEEQTAQVNSFFRKQDRLSPPQNPLIKTIKVCPHCIQRDREMYGEPYYHRCHQLPGVSVCPEHHAPLLTFGEEHDSKKRICSFDFDSCKPVENASTMADSIAYAEYARYLLNANIHSDIATIKSIIQNEFSDRGYRARSLSCTFYKDLENWQYHLLFDIPAEDFSLWLAVLRERKPETILGLLMFLFPNPEDLVKRIDTGTPLINKYTCEKGHVYYATQHAHMTGWGCPECDKFLTYDERYRRLVDVLGNGEYIVMEPFKSNDKKLRHFHCVCKQEVSIKPRKFISYGERCPCRIRIPEAEIRSWVEEHGFELIDYTNASDKMTLLHPACGETFDVVRAMFLNNTRCRICEDPRHGRGAVKAISEQLQEVVGSEYELLTYDDETKTMTLKHKSCDSTFTLSRNGFFNGQRCPQCTQLPTYRMLAEAVPEASNGRLVLDGEKIPGGSQVVLLNTEDGSRNNYRRAYLAQELSRPTPSALFPERQKEYAFPDWRTYLTLYKDYLSKYGEEPSRKVEYRELPLGVWCMHMRKMRKAGKLTDERIEILSDAGFDWGKSADT